MHKFMISGGGTGGHIFPAIAIANEIRRREPDAQIRFVGAQNRMEMEKVPQAGYPITGLWISGFQRSLSFKNLLFPFKVVWSLWQCYGLLRSFKPHAVIGTGGFASGPLLRVAGWMNIPTLIQEQNSYAGVTNKLLGQKARCICLGFEAARRFFPADKTRVTGNPVRESICHLPGRSEACRKLGLDPDKKVLLAMGGSLGARTINQSMEALLEQADAAGIQVIWQTGKNYTPTRKPGLGWTGPFIEEMETVYAAADLIVSRAGAIAISELCIVGKPVILIPSPHVAEDHQTKNALALAEQGAALLLPDARAREELWNSVQSVLTDPIRERQLASAIHALAQPKAAHLITDAVFDILNGVAHVPERL